jgi:hypothetical protein
MMRLLKREKDGNLSLIEFFSTKAPAYAILSHTWEPNNQEVTYRDFIEGTAEGKCGYQKIIFCSNQATVNGLEYFW